MTFPKNAHSSHCKYLAEHSSKCGIKWNLGDEHSLKCLTKWKLHCHVILFYFISKFETNSLKKITRFLYMVQVGTLKYTYKDPNFFFSFQIF
jgi:hypothetical protein